MTEHWIFPKIGLTQYWIAHQKKLLNWPALLAWIISIAVAMVLWLSDTLHLFFLLIPVAILTFVLYLLFAALAGAKKVAPESAPDQAASTPAPAAETSRPAANPLQTHHWIWGGFALAALIACFWMPLQVFLGGMDNYDSNMTFFKKWLILPTLVYFIAGTAWRILRERETEL